MPTTPPWRLALLGAALAASVAGLLLVVARPGQGPAELPLRDFVEYWAAGRLLAQGEDPYDPALVHALERQFGDQLVEPFGRGSGLTEAGKLLAELIGPAVLSISSLKQAYHEARGRLRPRLTVAVTPRVLIEDLPECVRAFTERYPRVHLTIREYRRDQIPAASAGPCPPLGYTLLQRGVRPTCAASLAER